MPISLDEALKWIFSERRGLSIEGEVFPNSLSEDTRYFLHLLISIGRNIHKKFRMNFSSLIILESIHQNSENSKNAGTGT